MTFCCCKTKLLVITFKFSLFSSFKVSGFMIPKTGKPEYLKKTQNKSDKLLMNCLGLLVIKSAPTAEHSHEFYGAAAAIGKISKCVMVHLSCWHIGSECSLDCGVLFFFTLLKISYASSTLLSTLLWKNLCTVLLDRCCLQWPHQRVARDFQSFSSLCHVTQENPVKIITQ